MLAISINVFTGLCCYSQHWWICAMDHAEQTDTLSKWEFNANNRYFKSFRHFIGTKEQKQRVEQGTDVINHSYTLDITPTYHLNKWWSFSMDVPIMANSRSSLYEHDGKTRYLYPCFWYWVMFV